MVLSDAILSLGSATVPLEDKGQTASNPVEGERMGQTASCPASVRMEGPVMQKLATASAGADGLDRSVPSRLLCIHLKAKKKKDRGSMV